MIPPGAISADSHVVEPPNCYLDYIDAKYRDDAPHVATQEDGSDAWIIKGFKRPIGIGLMDGAGYAPKERAQRIRTLKAEDVRPGGYDGRARAEYMDRDGIAAEVVFASVGMVLCMPRWLRYLKSCALRSPMASIFVMRLLPRSLLLPCRAFARQTCVWAKIA